MAIWASASLCCRSASCSVEAAPYSVSYRADFVKEMGTCLQGSIEQGLLLRHSDHHRGTLPRRLNSEDVKTSRISVVVGLQLKPAPFNYSCPEVYMHAGILYTAAVKQERCAARYVEYVLRQ